MGNGSTTERLSLLGSANFVAMLHDERFPAGGFSADGSGNIIGTDKNGVQRWSMGTAGVSAVGAGAFSGLLTTQGGIASGTSLRVGGVASSLVAAGTAITNLAVETVAASVTLPANTIGLGTIVRIRGSILVTASQSTDTLLFKLRIGATTLTGTAVLTGAAVDVANSSFAVFDFVLNGMAAAGAAAACVGSGQLSNFGTTSTGVAAAPQNLASTNFATNGALLIEATLTWSVQSASNSAFVQQFNVEVIPAA